MLLGICLILLLSWCVVSHWQTRRALRWWFSREAGDRITLSSQIQDHLLQDLFALRLQLQAPGFKEAEQTHLLHQTWLGEVENLYRELNKLSHSLASPYLAESLPLAIRSFLNQWQADHPQHQLHINLPHEWTKEDFERNHMILATLAILLKFALPGSLPSTALAISLIHRSKTAELVVKITYPDRLTITSITGARELKYLRHCFRCLTPGWCRYQHQYLETIWQFHWKL